MLRDLEQLLDLAELSYQAELQKMKAVMARENALRAQLTQVDDRERAAREQLAQPQIMQQIGADLRWQAWCMRKRRELNMDLAQVMAQKLPLQEALRRSFGRKTALADLVAQEKAKRKQTTERRQAARLLGLE